MLPMCLLLLFFLMNVVEEHQPNCLVTLHVEVPVDRVAREWDGVVNEFRKHASLRGFRKGAAPTKLIESHFSKEIRHELERILLDSSLREAIKNKKLDVVSILNFENIELERNRPLRFSAKVVTAPIFELPPYTGIEIEVTAPIVKEDVVAHMLEKLRCRQATYESVEGRGLEMGDFAVVSYTTQLDGEPLQNSVPHAPQPLLGGENKWLQLSSETLLPGFSKALLGIQPGETKNFELEVDLEFSTEDLRGKKVAFQTTLKAIHKENLPEWSDELANRIFPGKTVDELKGILRNNLETAAQQEFESRKRQEAIDFLIKHVQTELPAHLVDSEMTKVLREILDENKVHGARVPETLANQDDIVNFAKRSARDRVLGRFLLLKIAEKENIQVTEEDLSAQILGMSRRYDIPVPKLVKDLTRKNAFGWVREEILLGKALDFVVSNASVHEPIA